MTPPSLRIVRPSPPSTQQPPPKQPRRAWPEPNLAHLRAMTTPLGLFEHALGPEPRPEHGFCLDDVARGLVVTVRACDRSPAERPEAAEELASGYLEFILAAADGTGRFRNRRDVDGRWTDEPAIADHWGRALWGLGVAAQGRVPELVAPAIDCALPAMSARSPYPHAMAYAAIGAAELHQVLPEEAGPVALLHAAQHVIGRPGPDPAWPWPAPRLTYANALLPEALIAVGQALGDTRAVEDGLALLSWLVALQTRDGHFSAVPVGGYGPGDRMPGFDQQPIEAAATAEACWRAYEATGDLGWLAFLDLAAAWFLGGNDVGAALYDPATGGGCDGLTATGTNQNQGAESTLAALSAMQLAARAAAVGRTSAQVVLP